MKMIKNRFEYLHRHWFVRNVATLQAGSFAGTLVQAMAGVFLARLLQPEFFGVYSLAFGLAGMGAFLLGAGNQEAVSTMLGAAYAKNNREEVGEALAYLLKITFYAGITTALFLVFFPAAADFLYSNSIIGLYAGIIILGVFLSTSFNAMVQLSLQVVGRIKILTAVVFADQLFRYGFSVLFVYLGFGVLGAVSGHLIGSVILFIVSVLVWEYLRGLNNILPSLRNLTEHIKRVSISKYLGFSFWVALDRNMSNLYMTLPVVLTGIFVSVGEVSFFKLAFGYINIGLSLLGPISTLLNIEFPKMKVEDVNKLAKNFIKVSLYGLLLSTALTILMIIASPFAFKILYGESFMPSINYVVGLVAYGAFFGVGVGLGPMWRAVNKVKISIMINLIVLVVGVPLGIILIKYFGLWGSVFMVTLWFSFSHFASFIYLAKNIKNLPQN